MPFGSTEGFSQSVRLGSLGFCWCGPGFTHGFFWFAWLLWHLILIARHVEPCSASRFDFMSNCLTE